MIYRRPIRDVVEERHGRIFGVHVFVCYGMALAAVLCMSLACLAATSTGYFAYVQESEHRNHEASYDITYGWRFMCSRVRVDFKAPSTDAPKQYFNCFGLDDTEYLPEVEGADLEIPWAAGEIPWAAGSSMAADTGLAVALGHAVAAAVALTHVIFFVLLFLNIEPVPVRGYMYMRGLGLMTALSSFYLIFTGVVSFFFGVKDSLDSYMESSSGLRPSWAYILTVVDVILMMLVATKACHDDQVDAAIATPQYTSSSRNEDTVKRASGQLLHLRSKSSDTILEGSATNLPTSAPKATTGVAGNSDGDDVELGVGGRLPLVSVSSVSLSLIGGSRAAGPSITTTAGAAGAGGATGEGGVVGADGALPSPVPSASARTSWTGQISGFSPSVQRRGDNEGFGDDDGPEPREGAEGGDVAMDPCGAGAEQFFGGRNDVETGGVVESRSLAAVAAAAEAATAGLPVGEDDGEGFEQRQQEEGKVLDKDKGEEDVEDIEGGRVRVGVSLERERPGGAEETPREKEASLSLGDGNCGDGQCEAAALPRRAGEATDSAPLEDTLAEFSTARTDVSVALNDRGAAGAGVEAGMREDASSQAIAPGDESV